MVSGKADWPENLEMKLGITITALCKARNWSLARLARESGVPPQTLHHWTVGRKSINPDQVKRLANTLGVSVHFLLFGEADPMESPAEEILKEIFSGDVRVTLHRIERKKK